MQVQLILFSAVLAALFTRSACDCLRLEDSLSDLHQKGNGSSPTYRVMHRKHMEPPFLIYVSSCPRGQHRRSVTVTVTRNINIYICRIHVGCSTKQAKKKATHPGAINDHFCTKYFDDKPASL